MLMHWLLRAGSKLATALTAFTEGVARVALTTIAACLADVVGQGAGACVVRAARGVGRPFATLAAS